MGDQRFIAYCRSSTRQQTIGLEMQRAAIDDYVQRKQAEIVDRYQDVGPASPTNYGLARQQPQLVLAMARAENENAAVIVSRLDRLTRSTAVLALMLECGPPLLVVETPGAAPFVLQIYAAVAEEYRRRVSRRVRAGIAAARARGRDTHKHAYASGLGNRAAAKRYAESIRPIIETIRRGRSLSRGDVAVELNGRGLRTIRGCLWNEENVAVLWQWFHMTWSSTRFRGRQSRSGAVALDAANRRAKEFGMLIRVYRERGAKNAEAVMKLLNRGRVPSVTGKPWSLSMTRRLLRRLQRIR
jgi:DNA invertase Pin-like site-specific DNA recombinase